MELHKKSELSLGSSAFVIDTSLSGEATPTIETRVRGGDGAVVYETSQDISALKPIFQNSQQVFARLEAQHRSVVEDLEQGRLSEIGAAAGPGSDLGAGADPETDALEHAVALLGKGSFDKATAALRAVLETYPNCSEARELLEVSYKASSHARLPVDVGLALARGVEAFADGRQRDAIEAWKQCLIEEPGNRRLQLLVLMATTWSAGRRTAYAREVLAGTEALLKAGRPEEAQALLLVAQTVESAGDATLVGPPPAVAAKTAAELEVGGAAEPPVVASTQPAAPAPPAPRVDTDAPTRRLEALVPEEPPTVAMPPPDPPPPRRAEPERPPAAPAAVPEARSAPAPERPARPKEPLDDPKTAPVEPAAVARALSKPRSESPRPSQPESPPATSKHVATTPAPRPAEPRPTRPSEPEIPAASSKPGASSPAQAPPAHEATGAPAVADATEASPRPAPPRPHPQMRRPMARPPRRSPWPLVGGAAAALAVVAAVGFWFSSGGNAVPQARLEQAAGLVSAGQYAQGVAAYDALLSEFGERSELFLGRGRAKLSSQDAEGGIADLKRAFDLDPQASAIAEEIADLSYSRGNYPEAILYYEKAFALGAGSAEGRYRLAASLVQRDRGDDAIAHLQAAIGKDPAHGEAQFLYGQLLNQRGRFAEAEKAFRAAQPHVEAGGDFKAQLGLALLEQGKLDEAEEISRDFIRGYPNDARGRSLLGEVYLRRAQFEPARAQLIQALRLDPNEPRAQIALGRTWLAIGRARNDAQDLGKARQVLESASGVDEGQRLLGLGLVSLAQGDVASATSLLGRSLDEGAPELEVRLALAETKARAKDLVGAAEELQRASGLAADDAGISLSLAVVYSELKEVDRAAEEFLKTLQAVGLVTPPGEDAGPVVLPSPYVPLPERFNLNRTIRDAYQTVLGRAEDDPTANELKALAEPSNFVLSGAR